jgi:hypothetical protein
MRAVAFSAWPGEGCEAANFGLALYTLKPVVAAVAQFSPMRFSPYGLGFGPQALSDAQKQAGQEGKQ